jgi:hypothetical protein
MRLQTACQGLVEFGEVADVAVLRCCTALDPGGSRHLVPRDLPQLMYVLRRISGDDRPGRPETRHFDTSRRSGIGHAETTDRHSGGLFIISRTTLTLGHTVAHCDGQ